MKTLLLLLLFTLTLTSVQNYLMNSEIKNSGEIVFDTFYRQVRSWIYGESTDETRSSWWNLETVTSWYHVVTRSSWWNLEPVTSWYQGVTRSFWWNLEPVTSWYHVITRSSWWNLEPVTSWYHAITRSSWWNLEAVTSWYHAITRSSWWNLEPLTSWYHVISRSARESSWWFPARSENIRETSPATETSWWKFGWVGLTEDGRWNLADTFKSVSTYLRDGRWWSGLDELTSGATGAFTTVLTYLRDCRWWPGLEELKLHATWIFNTVSTYLRDCRWCLGIEELKLNAKEIYTTVRQHLEKNFWLLSLAFIVVVASSALLWWYKAASKARKKQLRKELEFVPDTRATAYLRFIANNINSSENAIIARPSHSDEFLLTPLSSTTEIEDQRESQVPVNFLPTVDIEFTVTSTRHVIWLEYVTRDYY